MGWWDFAVRAFALLTTPRADVARCDRDVEALARDSIVGHALHAVNLTVRCAWMSSRARRAAQALVSAVVPVDGAAAWRVSGWMVAVVGATAFVLSPLATRDQGPLIRLTPAVLVVAGLFVAACAAPLARASADRRRSPSSTQ